MQKVISVNINAKPKPENSVFSEHEFPEVNKYLSEGFKIVQVYQIAPSPNLYCTTITFILEKQES
jgi:hypothetical protein